MKSNLDFFGLLFTSQTRKPCAISRRESSFLFVSVCSESMEILIDGVLY